LPPVTQLLNRVLALRIGLQNRLFAVFEELLDARIEAAVSAGIYDLGVGWAVQRARYMTLETIAPLRDDLNLMLPAAAA
jgi:hypothetical protein